VVDAVDVVDTVYGIVVPADKTNVLSLMITKVRALPEEKVDIRVMMTVVGCKAEPPSLVTVRIEVASCVVADIFLAL
jgi:hypothetical protein